ncbi:TPA: hypothetical protein QDZ34_003455 [Stenotrophomonas maltophilia]|nr:hypothetical protein [Stenotrophomonas maltophilia]HDS1027275.1 hypothetical protein [Stenotrophomonas maltophilia]HDS1031708.1 hypothetical protein [Stenotrophomonas maltophilia]HDS1036075.1 hypothetical protein [Stenotrophomonas maltophilia]
MRIPKDMRGIAGKRFVKHPPGIHLHMPRRPTIGARKRTLCGVWSGTQVLYTVLLNIVFSSATRDVFHFQAILLFALEDAG